VYITPQNTSSDTQRSHHSAVYDTPWSHIPRCILHREIFKKCISATPRLRYTAELTFCQISQIQNRPRVPVPLMGGAI